MSHVPIESPQSLSPRSRPSEKTMPRASRPVDAPRAAVRRRRLLLLSLALLAAATVLLPGAGAIITPDEPTPQKSEAKAVGPTSNGAATQASDAAGSKDGASRVAMTSGGPPSASAAPAVASATGSGAQIPSDAASPGVEKPGDKALSVKAPADQDSSSAAPASTVEVVHERYVRGRGASNAGYFDDDEVDDRILFSSSFEIDDSDSDNGGPPGSGKRQNYASLDAGATILDSSPELKSPTNLLVPDKDRYMLMPCEKPRKWVVVSLSEDVHADAIAVANYEKYSSTVKEFIVLGSVNYPTDTWFVLGNFTAAQQNGEQIFPLDAQHHVRYIKLRFFSHYGSEYYCTLSQLKVYGKTFTQVISQLEKSIDADSALNVPSLPSLTEEKPRFESLEEVESIPSTTINVEAAETALLVSTSKHHCIMDDWTLNLLTSGNIPPAVCREEDAPKQSPAKPPPFLPQPTPKEDQSDSPLTARELSALESLGRHVESDTASSSVHSPTLNTSNTTGTGTAPTSRINSSSSAVAPAGTPSNALHAQGLGRLESIFVRITKKIQQLELNQSMFGRLLEENQVQQRNLAISLHNKHDAMAAQIDEIRVLLTEMNTRMEGETVSNDEYRRIVDELRKENLALWNEMLIVRDVITTMKAAILCALALSACIIVFYLLRVLFRCIQSAKRRADLREWSWRLESFTHHQKEEAKPKSSGSESEPVGAWRVNYKKQFGSSWDDHAIERKTLLREIVSEEAGSLQTVHGGQRSKRLRTASLTVSPNLKDLIAQMEKVQRAVEAEVMVKGGETDSDINPADSE